MGPPSSAMESMGDKIESKKVAAKAGVNTIPGFKVRGRCSHVRRRFWGKPKKKTPRLISASTLEHDYFLFSFVSIVFV